MINIIRRYFAIKRHTKQRYRFQVIGNVLIVHVPTGKMPYTKAQEHLSKISDMLNNNIEDFKVNKIITVAVNG